MSQKITITTKVQKATNAIDKVEYQWHWNRIVFACSCLLFILASVVWGLSSGVAANEPQIVSENKVKTSVKTLPSPELKAIKNSLSTEKIQPQANEIKTVQVEAVTANTTQELKKPELKAKSVEPEVHVKKQETQSHLSKMSRGSLMNTDFVTRAVLTTAVKNKEPVDVLDEQISHFKINEQLFFFTEINNLKSQAVFHRWFFKGDLVAEVELNIFSMRYRTFSSKKIMLKQSGNWRVELVNANNDVLASKSFHIK